MGQLGWAAWTRWDTRLFVRAAGAAAGALVLTWLVTAATDEGGVPWGERVGRTLPLAPVCAALGAALVLAPLRARGELRALASLGRTRLQVVAAAVAGGALVAWLAALAIGLLARVHVDGFYPTATHGTGWRWDGAAFVDAARGLRIGADGAPTRGPVVAGFVAGGLPAHARAGAAWTTALAGLALPLLLAHTMLTGESDRRFGRVDLLLGGAAALSVAASIVLFQAAAAHQVPALAATLPALALLGLAAQRYRGLP